ncbi:Salivary glue protein Sgs-4 [Cucumispora dikerogammari]|nr:Salivary glue protein Sgs-4 [Cucumispora dikerogammari]
MKLILLKNLLSNFICHLTLSSFFYLLTIKTSNSFNSEKNINENHFPTLNDVHRKTLNSPSSSHTYPPINLNKVDTNKYKNDISRYTEPPTRYTEPPARYTEPPTRYAEPSSRYTEPPSHYTEPLRNNYIVPLNENYIKPPKNNYLPSTGNTDNNKNNKITPIKPNKLSNGPISYKELRALTSNQNDICRQDLNLTDVDALIAQINSNKINLSTQNKENQIISLKLQDDALKQKLNEIDERLKYLNSLKNSLKNKKVEDPNVILKEVDYIPTFTSESMPLKHHVELLNENVKVIQDMELEKLKKDLDLEELHLVPLSKYAKETGDKQLFEEFENLNLNPKIFIPIIEDADLGTNHNNMVEDDIINNSAMHNNHNNKEFMNSELGKKKEKEKNRVFY